MVFKLIRLRRNFRRELARQTPLINGRETKKVAAAISYDAEIAQLVIEENIVPFEPRETFRDRLLVAL